MAQDFDPEALIKSLTAKPGVYRMIDSGDQVLYVGKARNLRKRVGSYFQRTSQGPKTQSMVRQIRRVEITITHTEGEALLLESNLIKELKPRYNILLRDDKSYPYILLSSTDNFPRLSFHRGTRRAKGQYYGPFPSAGSVRETLNLLQKVFLIRQCEDSFFNNRSRPCLQYQIKRCNAPCVGLISQEDYREDIRLVKLFLDGKSNQVVDKLVVRMEKASVILDYEKAAGFRDQINKLKRVQEKQYITSGHGDIDVIACFEKQGVACVQVVFIRGGMILGHKAFYPKYAGHEDVEAILTAFISQYYLNQAAGKIIPPVIITSHSLIDEGLLTRVLNHQAGHSVQLLNRVRGDRVQWVKMALTNAQSAVVSQLASKTNLLKRFEQLQDALGLESQPQRLECFDISHTAGNDTVASCVVMDITGPVKSDYRRFNIEGITPGDDYAAMKQALTRRYTRLKKGEGKVPDILFIDGGKGQLSEAIHALQELQVSDVVLVGVAKGADRQPGLETLFLAGRRTPINLPSESSALLLIQQIRDEAHRFAITGHRQRRAKGKKSSILESIPGLGPKRRQRLLKQFGGLQGIARAGIADLSTVSGINKQLAQRVYDMFHTDG